MLCTEMALDAAAPAPHKRKVQRAADSRAGERNQTTSPLFRRLGANLRGEAFREALGIANQCGRDGVQMLRGNVFHSREVRNPQAVLVGEVTPEVFRVNLDRTQSAEHAKSQKAADGTSRQRSFDRVVKPHHAY